MLSKLFFITGAGYLLRDPGKNPPSVRNALEKIGNDTINSIKLIRTPLSAVNKFLLNIVSLGDLEAKMKEAKVDKLFHLSMLINNEYELDKQEVIKLKYNPQAVKNTSDVLEVPVYKKNITIKALLDNTLKRMGPDRYSGYDAKSNNCSNFISNVLAANKLDNPNTTSFVDQRVDEIFHKFPSISEKIIKLATDLGAVVDRQTQGEGKKNSTRNKQ